MNKHQSTRSTPLEDKTPPRVYEEFEIPLAPVGGPEDEPAPDWMITQDEARTQDFGVLQVIGMKRLTPLEEKSQVAKARGDALRIAYELTAGSLGFIINTEGNRIAVHGHDGSVDMLLAQMHPKIRALCMQGYGDIATPSNKATKSFLESRKTRA